jgi:hypothetical protein
MIPPLDILRVDPSGDLKWLELTRDIDAAKVRLKVLGAATPGKYVVFSHRSGNRRFFTVDQSGDVTEGVE